MKKSSVSKDCYKYGEEVDRLTIAKDYDGLDNYLVTLNTVASSNNSPEYTPVFYYLGTAYATLANHNKNRENEYREKALYNLRHALNLSKGCETPEALLLCIYTNYANELDTCGRVIEALKIYRNSISLNPKFSMALGNYGRALLFYGNLVNDFGHRKVLYCYAYEAIQNALDYKDPNMHKEASACFNALINDFNNSPWYKYVSKPIAFDKYDMGTPNENEYRKWCLKNHLFLNPLNDVIETETAFAHDPLTITQYTEDYEKDDINCKNSSEPPKWFAMVNQLKEEYIYSRFMCYEGMEKRNLPHYADKNVLLSLSSHNYVNYSIRIEQLKTAFKNLFSIFDKVAFFINDFWKIGENERNADAYHVFKNDKYPKNNSALTALYWSYCEFKKEFGDSKDLKILRNAIEHKYVKIHEFSKNYSMKISDDGFYHISEQMLIQRVIRMLELAREWIMELVYAIDIEEQKHKTNKNAIQLFIPNFEDDWKL